MAMSMVLEEHETHMGQLLHESEGTWEIRRSRSGLEVRVLWWDCDIKVGAAGFRGGGRKWLGWKR